MSDRNALVCANCSTTFAAAPKGPLPARCPPCTVQATAARHRTYYGGDRDSFACPDCGVLVTPARMGPAPTACPTCSDQRWRGYRATYRCPDPEKQREKWRAAKAQRTARKKRQPYEQFTHREIYERDGWVCGICRGLVDSSLAYPHPWSASLDHVVPRCAQNSPGHVRSNVQCSHLWCNTVVKHDRQITEELVNDILIHKRTGALVAVDGDVQREMALLQGHRPLSDDERSNLQAGDGAAAAVDASATGIDAGAPDHGAPQELAPPPRTGTGSGRGPWAEYAAAHGVTVADSAAREDIVEQLMTAGVRVE